MEELKKSIEVSKLITEVAVLLKQNMIKGFEDLGITAPQGMVIGILCKYGKMKISELSNKMGLSNSTVSGIVDRLEKQGIAYRIRSEDDRRVVYVSLSENFQQVHKDFHKRAEENIANTMSKATPEDVDKIIEGLDILKKLLNDR